MPRQKKTHEVMPFTVIIDTREQAPWRFTDIKGDAPRHLPVIVPTTVGTLKTGDYSIDGHQSAVAIQRKSLADLFGSLTNSKNDPDRRDRFEDEVCRLHTLSAGHYDGAGCVIVEGDINDIFNSPPPNSGLNPKSVWRTIVSWWVRYPGCAWWLMPGRRAAELLAFQIFKKWHEQHTPTPVK